MAAGRNDRRLGATNASAIFRLQEVGLSFKAKEMRTMLLHPSSEIPDDVPIEQIRLPWNIRRILTDAGLETVGDVRKAANETLLGLKLNRGVIDFIRATLGSRATIELKLGDRVRLSELGVFRSSKIRVRTGVVVALSSRRSCGASLGILFDGNKRPTTLHRSYVELDEEAKGK